MTRKPTFGNPAFEPAAQDHVAQHGRGSSGTQAAQASQGDAAAGPGPTGPPPRNALGAGAVEAERQAMAALDARIRACFAPRPRGQPTPPA